MWTAAGTARQIAQHARSVTPQASCRAAYTVPAYTYISKKQTSPVAQALLKTAPWRKPEPTTKKTKETGETKSSKGSKATKTTKTTKSKKTKDSDPAEPNGDKTRMNIVSKKLCSKYM